MTEQNPPTVSALLNSGFALVNEYITAHNVPERLDALVKAEGAFSAIARDVRAQIQLALDNVRASAPQVTPQVAPQVAGTTETGQP